MNMILSKRHIILAALVLCLGIAVYLNWTYSTTGEDFVATDAAGDSATAKNYGDSKYVSKDGDEVQVTANSSYFKEARLSRTKSRDEAMDSLKKMFKDASLTEEEKTALAMKASTLAEAIENEGTVENLIRAKGVGDCMVYLDADKADIVVQTEGLTKETVAQIKDIILSQTNVAVENISITETK